MPTVKTQEGPAGFHWDEGCRPEDTLPDHGGCRCPAGGCERATCPCACAVLARDEAGRLVVLPGHQSEPAEMELTECGPSCACFSGCGLGFSTAAAELAPLVSLRWGEGKGSGVYADEALPARMVVGHYAGEYVSNLEAAKRLREYDAAGGGHALLVLREWLPSGTAAIRINIDATHRSNLPRFFNHSCDGGNLHLCLGRQSGSLFPRVVFVTSRPVAAGEEMTYAYGPPNGGPGGKRCHCGTPACLGFMPHGDV